MDMIMGTPSKRRSVSEMATTATTATLQPSPNLTRAAVTKDDNAVPTSPQTPRRPDFLGRGLSLQMPSRTMSMAAPKDIPRVPLSPQLDPLTSYASPQASIPRHSRGLDFSRACTNLHHSTLAEQSSPDSSPIVTHKAMGIPSRKASMSSMMLDPPSLGPGMNWPVMHPERSAVSSSVGSVNMLGSDSGSSDTSDDDVMDDDDAILSTPQVRKINNPSAATPFGNNSTAIPWSSNFSPAHASLMKNFQRSRLGKGRSRKSSSSASANSAMPSPRTTSPPPLRSIEGSGYFGWPRLGSSRRESIALGTEQPNLSSGNDSGDEAQVPSTPGVVRRAVTRRGNLLPKTKNFARIRAALLEESAPVDTEVRREAETMRQVQERDPTDPDLERPSPGPSRANEGETTDFPHQSSSQNNANTATNPISFNLHAHRNSGGMEYWHKLDKELHTPPPPAFIPRNSSSMSGDITMESPASDPTLRSASVATEPSAQEDTPTFDTLRKFGAKRRRDDDFDIQSFKRRAVSPSMQSVHGSPVVSASPARGGAGTGGDTGRNPSVPREADGGNGGRSNSGGSSQGLLGAPKRVGLQGMVDTNDGIMRMSIE